MKNGKESQFGCKNAGLSTAIPGKTLAVEWSGVERRAQTEEIFRRSSSQYPVIVPGS